MHIYCLNENFLSVMTILPPGAKERLTKFSAFVLRSTLLSYWSGLSKRFLKYKKKAVAIALYRF